MSGLHTTITRAGLRTVPIKKPLRLLILSVVHQPERVREHVVLGLEARGLNELHARGKRVRKEAILPVEVGMLGHFATPSGAARVRPMKTYSRGTY